MVEVRLLSGKRQSARRLLYKELRYNNNMEETIRTLTDILSQLKTQSAIEFTNRKRLGNQASMACNIIRELQAEFIRIEEECNRLDQWKQNVSSWID